jgi:predicted ATPase
LAVGRLFEAILFSFLREPLQVEIAATQALAIAEEYGFAFAAAIRLPLGWAWAQLGRAREGVALMRQALAEFGTRAFIIAPLTYLAEAQALDGKIDDALIIIEEALAPNEEVVFQPYPLTYRGELRLKVGQTELAEADFRDAIALAQKMKAKAWELRATTSLARLLRDNGRRDEAHAMLAEIYNWFTEGFATADLKDAKPLLDELSA